MTSRLSSIEKYLGLIQPLIDFANYSHEGLDSTVVHLVEIRASQINGCAPCLYLHTRDARKSGETEDRLNLLAAWRESALFSEPERAALGWTEVLTRVADAGAPDDAYEALQAQFSPEEQIKLTLVIAAINGFNRLNVGFHVQHPVSSRKAA